MEANRQVILLIENEEDDIFMFRRALAQIDFTGTVRVVGSVSEAQQYLLGAGKFGDSKYFPCPDIIVSDMGLPGQSGNRFLEWLRSDTRCAHIPFVFLSGTSLPLERIRAAALGVTADQFFTKTGDMSEMRKRVEEILKFLPSDHGENSSSA